MDYFEKLEKTVESALSEDIGTGDLTSRLISPEKENVARIITRDEMVLCGRPWVDETLKQVDSESRIIWQFEEGEEATPGDVLLQIRGKARSLLTAERTMLNFLQLLSAVATETRKLTRVIKDSGATLLDTRKTIPGLRLAQKYAVKTGGGQNHRIGLFDAFLIKENHINAAGSISSAIKKAKEIAKKARIEIEVENIEELEEAVSEKPDWILLDNFSIQDMQKAVKTVNGLGIKLEASGGIEDHENLLQIANTGVDYISMGQLTKNVKAVDMTLLFD